MAARAVKGAMAVMSASQFSIRVGLCVLLGSTSTSYLTAYITGEFALYIIFKSVRGEWRYWVPLRGPVGFFVSLVARFLMFQVVGGTSFLYGRHPHELGGLGWMLTHVLIHVSFVALATLLNFDGDDTLWDNGTIWGYVVTTLALWWTAFFTVLHFGEKDRVFSFYNPITAVQYERNAFEHGGDAKKSLVFTSHPKYWEGFIDEIHSWLKDNWARWESERPDFFTERWKKNIPIEMRPDFNQKMPTFTKQSFKRDSWHRKSSRSRNKGESTPAPEPKRRLSVELLARFGGKRKETDIWTTRREQNLCVLKEMKDGLELGLKGGTSEPTEPGK